MMKKKISIFLKKPLDFIEFFFLKSSFFTSKDYKNIDSKRLNQSAEKIHAMV